MQNIEVLFADDASICSSGEKILEIITTEKWFDWNKLSLNLDKKLNKE